MAKTTKCAFCGKEMTKGFLSGDAEDLNITSMITLDCCAECKEKYKPMRKARSDRFDAKLHNMRRANKNRKFTDEEIGRLYVEYCEIEDSMPESGFTDYTDFYAFNSDGSFYVNEYKLGFINQDGGMSSMLKSELKNAFSHGKAFTKDDITRIEYRRVGWLGVSNGLFQKAYSYEIRLNDESKFFYQPAITRTVVFGTHLPFFQFISADKKMKKIMEQFKKNIKSDLPVVQVKKFTY